MVGALRSLQRAGADGSGCVPRAGGGAGEAEVRQLLGTMGEGVRSG